MDKATNALHFGILFIT